MAERNFRILGRSDLRTGRLGVSCGYGAPTEAFEEAFEHGVNYFYWGSMRKTAMARAIRNIIRQGKRDDLIIVIQSYSRSASLMERFYVQALKTLKIDAADILLLGWHNRRPSARILDRAIQMKEKGMFRFLALSGHDRPLFAELTEDTRFDLFHLRYNAVHRGAESDVFEQLPQARRPGIVAYTATRWGDLLKKSKMPKGEPPMSGAECYRFVLSNPDVDVCMTGPKNRAQMQEALQALELGPLSKEEMVRARHIGDHIHQHHRHMFA